jgi:hypothetical protein
MISILVVPRKGLERLKPQVRPAAFEYESLRLSVLISTGIHSLKGSAGELGPNCLS